MPNGANYQSTIDGFKGEGKSSATLTAMKPPHRIPKIDIRQAGKDDPLSPHYNVSQTSPNRFDSRLEKRKAEAVSQTPVHGNAHKVKHNKRVLDITDGA